MKLQMTRWIPADSTEHAHELGVAYSYERAGKHLVVAYGGKAAKPCFHESYSQAPKRDERITSFFSGLESSAKLKRELREARNRPHTLKAGDILHHSWGWEQTQCDYYQVLAVTPRGATIQEISSATVPGSEVSHGMADRRVAVPGSFHGEIIKVTVSGDNRVRKSTGVLSHGSCGPWDGEPNYCSWYA